MGYIGQVIPIPAGQGGLVGTKNQTDIAPDKLITARNVSLYGDALSKEGGAAKYNSSAITGGPTILGGWDWWPTSGTQRMVVACSDGKLYKDTGGGTFGTTLVSGLTITGTVPVFVDGGKEAAANNRKLFCFTGVNAVQVLSADGATTANLATPPADWSGSNQPTFGAVHKDGRMFAGGNANDPHRLYYSTTTNHEDYTGSGSGSISIYPGDGEKLVGAISFKGLIIAWKFPVGIYAVDTSDPLVTNWEVKRLSKNVGGVSPLGMIEVDDDILFIDPTGNVHALSAVTEFGDISASNLSRLNHIYQYLADNLNLSRLNTARAIYYAAKREAHFAVTGAGSSVNSVRFVVDFNDPQQIRFRWSDRDVCEALWLRKDVNNIHRPTTGDNAGFVWNLDQSSKTLGGAAFIGEFQTPHMDFKWVDPKLATVRKIGQFLECLVNPTGSWNLNVDIIWDGVTVQTVTFNMGVTGAALGSFTLGTDKLAGDQIVNRKRRIVGSGRRLSLRGYNSGTGEDFSVGQFFLHCLISDERLGRETA